VYTLSRNIFSIQKGCACTTQQCLCLTMFVLINIICCVVYTAAFATAPLHGKANSEYSEKRRGFGLGHVTKMHKYIGVLVQMFRSARKIRPLPPPLFELRVIN